MREDIYGSASAGLWASAPQDEILRYWLSNEIPRAAAEKALSKLNGEQVFAEQGTYIVRRASDKVNYAITVCEGGKICSYKVTDLGLGQVGIQTGQSFRSLEYLLEFFYEERFPDATGTHSPLKHMCTEPGRDLDGCPPMPEPQEVYEERYEDADGVPGGGNYGDDTYQDIDETGPDTGGPPARPPVSHSRAAPPPPGGGDVYGEDGDMYGEEGAPQYGEDETNYGEDDAYGEGGGGPAPAPDVYGDEEASPYGEDGDNYGDNTAYGEVTETPYGEESAYGE